MLEFSSASVRMVNSRRAIAECLEVALDGKTCDLILIHASTGHDFSQLADEALKLQPNARILGASCCGVVGREGVSESKKDVAVMTVTGKEFAVAHVDGITGENSYAKCAELATELRRQDPGIRMVYFLGSGIDISNDLCIAGLESVLGPDVTVFGATSSDDMRGVISYQIVDTQVFEHAAFAIGFSDPTLELDTQATHGFLAAGDPLVVTKSNGHKILELNGKPAWTEFTSRLGLPPSATPGDTIPVGALAEELPEHLAAEYGNPHILRVVTKRDDDGTMYYATDCPEGTVLKLTVRDELRIFDDLDRMMKMLVERSGDRKPVAVFHADCLARGKFLFNRVMKEELVNWMQHPLSTHGEPPPWLGMYGFGEFARLGGTNTFHNYTTALYVLYRR